MVAPMIEKTAAPTALTMTYEEYLQWCDEDVHAEWVDGEVIVFMPAKDEHQTIWDFLHRLLGDYVELLGLGKVQSAPFEVKLWRGGPSREPDIFFLKKENLHRLTSDRLSGPPDLIVEIISRDSVRRDRDTKFREYAQAGVSEYWIIDSRPGFHWAAFYRLSEDNQYELVATEDDERVESSVVSGFWLNPAWLWMVNKPNVMLTVVRTSPEATAAFQALQQGE